MVPVLCSCGGTRTHVGMHSLQGDDAMTACSCSLWNYETSFQNDVENLHLQISNCFYEVSFIQLYKVKQCLQSQPFVLVEYDCMVDHFDLIE